VTPSKFRSLVQELRTTDDLSRVDLLADMLQDAIVAARWADPGEVRDLEAAIRSRGLQPRGGLSVPPLGIGETMVLLFDRTTRRGATRRLRITRGAAASIFSSDAVRDLESARHGLLAELSAAARSISDEHLFASFSTDLRPDAEIVGGSFGVAASVAIVSAALKRPAATDVAASAQVRSDGKLLQVEELEAKLIAVRERWPAVRRVIVACEQPDVAVEGITLERHATLGAALRAFGLPLEDLEHSHVEAHEKRLDGFKQDNRERKSVEEWRQLAWRAVESAHVFASEGDRAREARCRSWASLFFLHAGEGFDSRAQIAHVPEQDAGEALGWKRLVEATNAIDDMDITSETDAQRVIELARRAVDILERDIELRGQAHGTLGRAFVHAARPADGEPHLRIGVEHHLQYAKPEVARSMTYLATCLRHQGRANDALAVADEAIRIAEQALNRQSNVTSIAFLELERGRCLANLARHDEAVIAFERVCAAYRTDHDYPRPAALRGLASSRRALGETGLAEDLLRRCLAVASSTTIGRAAVMAAADAILSNVGANIPVSELHQAWTSAFPDATTHDQMCAIHARFVY
jgi:tetratricopeptide (TPR) repeat protein